MADLFPERIETDRLVLTPVHEVDPVSLYEICAYDDGIGEVTEHLTWNPHTTPKETKTFLDSQQEAWEDGTGATYIIKLGESEDDTGEIAGGCGLALDWDRNVGELGMWLRKRYWGRGYSGERAAALLAVGFEHLDLDTIVVTTMDGNEKSKRAIEKYVEAHGGQYEGLLRSFVVEDIKTGGAADVHRFSVTQKEFEANRGGANTY